MSRAECEDCGGPRKPNTHYGRTPFCAPCQKVRDHAAWLRYVRSPKGIAMKKRQNIKSADRKEEWRKAWMKTEAYQQYLRRRVARHAALRKVIMAERWPGLVGRCRSILCTGTWKVTAYNQMRRACDDCRRVAP